MNPSYRRNDDQEVTAEQFRTAARFLARAAKNTLLICPEASVCWTARILAEVRNESLWRGVWENVLLRPDNLIWSWGKAVCVPGASAAEAATCIEGVSRLLDLRIREAAEVIAGTVAVRLLEGMVYCVQAAASRKAGSPDADAIQEQAARAYQQVFGILGDGAGRSIAWIAGERLRGAAPRALPITWVDGRLEESRGPWPLPPDDASRSISCVPGFWAEAISKEGLNRYAVPDPLALGLSVLDEPFLCVVRNAWERVSLENKPQSALLVWGLTGLAGVWTLGGSWKWAKGPIEAAFRSPLRSKTVTEDVDNCPLEELTSILRTHPSGNEREVAANALGSIEPKSRDAVAAIVLALNDTAVGVRIAAGYALKRFAPVARMIELLQEEEDPSLRSAAATGLKEVRVYAARAIPALLKAMSDGTVEVRRAATDALSWIAPDAFAAVGDLVHSLAPGHPEVRETATRALGGIAPDREPVLSALLGQTLHGEFNDRYYPARGIGWFGAAAKPAVEALIQQLQQGDVETRRCAADALGWIGHPARIAVPALIRALEHSDEQLQRRAAIALGGIGLDASNAVEPLASLMRTTNQPLRRCAVQALGRIGPSGILALVRGLDFDSADQEPMMFGPLFRFLHGDAEGQRWQREAAMTLRSATNADIEALIHVLEAGDHLFELVAVAEWMLARLGGIVVRPLLQAIGDLPDGFAIHNQIRGPALRRVCRVLGLIGPAAFPALPHLIAALHNDDAWGWGRVQAAEALGQIQVRSENVITALTGALNDTDHSVRDTAAVALCRLGQHNEKVTEGLVNALHQGGNYYALRALEALAQIRFASADAVSALTRTLTNLGYRDAYRFDSRLRNAAVVALSCLGSTGQRVLVSELINENEEIRWITAEALASCPEPNAM